VINRHETEQHGQPGCIVMGSHVVSKKRVADHGEVFTSPREVNAMLDLVQQEAERIESRFLEPACGTGNFLAEILERKLRVVTRRYRRSPLEHERYTLLAVSSVYGIDLLQDNVAECRCRLFALVERHCKNLFNEDFLHTIRFVLERNIIQGDALSLKTVGAEPEPIVFSEWSLVNGSMVKRRDFTFHELLSYAGTKERPLFSDLGEEVFFPEPVREFPLTHYLKIADAEGK
jgi:SAM-dependent methyltransferase